MAAIYYDCHAFCANELVCIPMRFIYPAANPAFLQLIEGKFRGERIRHFSPERELINEGSRLKSEIAPVSGVGCVISRHDRKWRERDNRHSKTSTRRHLWTNGRTVPVLAGKTEDRSNGEGEGRREIRNKIRIWIIVIING